MEKILEHHLFLNQENLLGPSLVPVYIEIFQNKISDFRASSKSTVGLIITSEAVLQRSPNRAAIRALVAPHRMPKNRTRRVQMVLFAIACLPAPASYPP